METKTIMNGLIEQFKNGKLANLAARAFILAPEIPMEKWSLQNQLIVMYNESEDARGYKQWQNVGRHVKKGSKAVYILVPNMFKEKDEKGEEVKVLRGFHGIPVFKYEDTDGDSLPEYEPKKYPPLYSLAEKKGIKIQWKNTRKGEKGSFDSNKNIITLCTENPVTYFHELIHWYDNEKKELKGIQDPIQETVAQFGACVLAKIYGIDDTGYTYTYIKSYTEYSQKVPNMCKKVLQKVDSIIEKIMKDAKELGIE